MPSLLDALEAAQRELAVARERYGPAGYKIITEVAALRTENLALRAANLDLRNERQLLRRVVDAARSYERAHAENDGVAWIHHLREALDALPPRTEDVMHLRWCSIHAGGKCDCNDPATQAEFRSLTEPKP